MNILAEQANKSLSLSLVENGKVIPMHFKENGEKDFEALARLGHHESRVVQASFTDLLPKDLNDGQAAALLQKPSEDEIEKQARETQEAFNRILAKNQNAGAINDHLPRQHQFYTLRPVKFQMRNKRIGQFPRVFLIGKMPRDTRSPWINV